MNVRKNHESEDDIWVTKLAKILVISKEDKLKE